MLHSADEQVAEQAAHRTVRRPVLTIAVPAYNRPAHLRQMLASIGPIKCSEELEILVCDDSDDELNRPAVDEFKTKFSNVRYVGNPSRLGIDGNIANCVDLARGHYVWLIGDDDRFVPGAVNRVLDVLRPIVHRKDSRKAPGLVVANYSYASSNFEFIFEERVIPVQEDVNMDASQLVERYSWALGFIGSFIIRADLWNGVKPPDRVPFMGNFYPHLGIGLCAIEGRQVTILNEPLILNRSETADDTTWKELALDVYFGFEDTLEALRPYYGGEAIDSAHTTATRLFKHRTLRWLGSRRADGTFGPEQVDHYVALASPSWLRKQIIKCIAYSPKAPWRILKWIAKTGPRRLRRQRAAALE